MWVNNINIKNFRNYEEQKIQFCKNINIFYGENAQGKTNIIESIFLSSLGKSFRTKKDSEMIMLGKENSIIEIEFEKKDRDGKIKIELGNKKNIYLNNIKIKKLSELLGNINIVIFTPEDINILKGGPENRRKFLNIMISQLRPNYMYIYNLYIKTLEHRNEYLRQIRENNKDENMLDIRDEKLSEYAIKICQYRTEFINKLNYWSIKGLAESNPAAKEMFDWILDPSENDRLEQIIEVGEIRNSKKFIDGLLSIYTKHKEDLKAVNKVKNALVRLGYDYDDINAAVREFLEDN